MICDPPKVPKERSDAKLVLLHSHPQYDFELEEAVLGDLQPFSSFSISIGLKLYEVIRI